MTDRSVSSQAPSQQSYGSQSQPPYQESQYQEKPPKKDKLSGLLGKIEGAVADIGSEVVSRISDALDPDSQSQHAAPSTNSQNRFGSFAPQRANNDVKWYVDGFNYMYAVSVALENARESIWILDCEYSYIVDRCFGC